MPPGAAAYLGPASRGPGARPGPVPARRSGPEARAGTGAASRQRRNSRVSRGEVRNAVLALLMQQPQHGYQIIQEISARSAGRWRPSPGSVYPTITRLESEGLVRTEQAHDRRVAHLTEQGRRYAGEHAEQLAAVFEQFGDAGMDERPGLREMAVRVGEAAAQVSRTGTEHHMTLAWEVLAETRRRLYRILADDHDDPPRP